MQKILYYCDLCGKELRRDDVKKASFTVSPIGGMLALNDVCDSCLKALNNALDRVIEERKKSKKRIGATMGNNDSHGVEGKKWTGFDLDGTLAEYEGWNGIENIGKPIKPMCDLIKRLHNEGEEVKILTARVSSRDDGTSQEEARKYIELWCEKNLGFVPPITHEKDSLMETLYDDRVQQVIPNTGITMEEASKRLFEHGQKDTIAQVLIDYLMDDYV